jgi:hypothetical protein
VAAFEDTELGRRNYGAVILFSMVVRGGLDAYFFGTEALQRGVCSPLHSLHAA